MPKICHGALDSLRLILSVLAVAGMASACTANTDSSTMQDGVGSSQQAPGSSGLAAACSNPSDGCPCATEGAEVACKGPKIQTGNYTTCTDGVRFCRDGVWSACIGKTLYQNVDLLSQEYTSPCGAGTVVHWGALTVQGATPGDSRIEVSVQGADSAQHLDLAPLVHVGTFDGSSPSGWPSVDVAAALSPSGLSSAPWLRVSVSLQQASQGGGSPSVAWQQAISCVPTYR